MDATDLAFAGIARQAELMEAGEISSQELVELHLERIARLDPDLNAYRIVFAERARAEARQADARRGAGERRPLLGLPIAIKDDCDVAGELTTRGTNAVDVPAAADAEVVRRVRAAGAVLIGKTNVPELEITPFTESPTFGATRNPWDPQRTSGGSSGGSATAVAAGLCAAAIGSDGAGSIRIPSAATGVFGLKPQQGRVPTAPKVAPWHGMSTWGAIARRVGDAARMYDVIADGPLGLDGESVSFAEAAAREPGRLRVAIAPGAPPLLGVQADAEQLGGLQSTADALRELGHEIVEGELDFPPAALANVLARYLRGIHDDARALPHPERLSRRTKGYARLGAAIPSALVERAKAAAAADAERLNSIFGLGVDVVVTPMFTRRPPRVLEYDGRPAWWTLNGSARLVPWCGPYNHTGQPAAAVPAGFAADGFPLAVQLVAPPGGEAVLLSLAAQLERASDWPAHVPPLAA
jgi:amidase